MTITELIPAVQDLSYGDKLRLLQMLVESLIQSEDIADIDSSEMSSKSRDVPLAYANKESLTLEARRDFLRKPLAERRRALAMQAEAMQSHYEQNEDWRELMSGDIVEY